MGVKKCLVPICRNTTDTPNKIFVHVPRNSGIQNNWRIAMKLPEIVHLGRNNVVCEDHFDLEKDAANWMYYKTMGKKLFLKPGVVPHKYMESPPPTDLPSGLSESAKKRKLDTLMDYSHQPMNHPLASTSKEAAVKKLLNKDSPDLQKSKIQAEVPSPSGSFRVHHSYGRITCSVGVQVNLRSNVKVRSVSTNTTKEVSFKAENMVDEASSPLFREKHLKLNVTSSSSSTSPKSSKSTVEYITSSSDSTYVDESEIK